MKKSLFCAFIVIIAVFISCSKENELHNNGQQSITLSFNASVDGEDVKTCISENDKNKVLWSTEEKISLFYPDAEGSSYIYKSSCFTSTNKDTARAVTFTGEITRNQFFAPIEAGSSTPLKYYAVYPYDESNEIVDGALLINIKKNQSGKNGSFENGEFPSVAQTIDNKLCFWNVCGGIAFTIINENITSIVFSSGNNEPLAGKAKVLIDENGLPTIENFVKDTSSIIILNAPTDKGYFTPGELYYITLAPTVLSNGFKISFLTENSKADTLTTKKIEIKRSKFGIIEKIDSGCIYKVKAVDLKLDTNSIVLRKNDEFTLHATVLPEETWDKSVIWNSSDESVATVSDGVVKAIGKGNCTITATSHSNPLLADTCNVTVKLEIDSVKITKYSKDLDFGEEATFEATVFPIETEYKSIKWTSSNDNIISIDNSGKVTAIKEGSARIIVSSELYPEITDEIEVTVTKVIHLDENKHYANCYIITSPGVYDFLPVKGVSGTELSAYSSAEVLWEGVSVGVQEIEKTDIIKSAELKRDRIRLTLANDFKDGNAVVAVKNSKGDILWSWHIWALKGYDIDKESFQCSNGQYLMGRHLGSVSNQPGAKRGLLYQWGRKDPFLASSTPNFFTSVDWPDAVENSSTTGTIEYAVKHPMTYIKGNSKHDWYNGSSELKTRWNSTAKSDYDPCPYGWKVPSGGEGGFWYVNANTEASHSWNYTYAGIDLKNVFGKTESCWFQCTGYMEYSYIFRAMDSLVELWSSDYSFSKTGTTAYYFAALSGGSIMTDYTTSCANGLSVRCVKDE